MIGWFGCHALLRDAEGTSRPADRNDVKTASSPTRSPPRLRSRQGHPAANCATMRCHGPLRLPLDGPVQPRLDPETAKLYHDETCRRKPQGRAFLLDVRPKFCSMKITQDVRIMRDAERSGGGDVDHRHHRGWDGADERKIQGDGRAGLSRCGEGEGE